jgi:hypothetical protein
VAVAIVSVTLVSTSRRSIVLELAKVNQFPEPLSDNIKDRGSSYGVFVLLVMIFSQQKSNGL